jgi:hypothetical protein
MANHLLQVEKAWLLSQIGTYIPAVIDMIYTLNNLLFKVLSLTAMMMSWTKYVS